MHSINIWNECLWNEWVQIISTFLRRFLLFETATKWFTLAKDTRLTTQKGAILERCFYYIIKANGNFTKQRNAKDGLLKEVKKREHYSKPGVKRREAKKEAIKNSRRRERSYN